MEDESIGWSRRRWCLAFLIFLFVYLPLDAFDADAFDTFDGGIVQVRVQAEEDAVNLVLHPVVIFAEAPRVATGLQPVVPVPEPICTLPVTSKSSNLPRSDDPHVAISHSVKSPARLVIV